MSQWQDAMFEQMEQREFLATELGQQYMLRMDDDFASDKTHPDDRDGELPRGWRYVIAAQTVQRAEPVWVSHDVSLIIETAMDDFQAEVVLPQDPFTLCGFAVFSKPIVIRDVNGIDLPIKAAGWLPMFAIPPGAPDRDLLPGNRAFTQEAVENSPGLWLTFWVSHSTPTTDVATGQPTPINYGHFIYEQNRHARLQAICSFFMPFKRRTFETLPADDPYGAAAREQWKLAQVLWRLGQQLVPGRERVIRQMRRDAHRRGMEQEHVTVVKLRRYKQGEPEGFGEGKQLDHRHIVHGHWKRVWYPSLGEHRQRYIMPYVRGPEDAPFRINERAFEFRR